MSAEVLQEFLIELGWKSDQAQEKRFLDSIGNATKAVVGLGAAIQALEVAAIGIAQKISGSFEALAYASSRVHASAANITAFRYAISQLGGTAEGALASLEAFSRKLRESPGEEARLKAWGVRTRDANGRLRDTTDLIKEMVKSERFRAQPYFTQLQLAESMGIDERTFRAILGDVDRFTEEYRRKLQAAGLDPDKAAENSKKFMTAWRSMIASLEMVIDRVAVKFGDKISGEIEKLTVWIDQHGDEIADTLDKIVTALIEAAKWVSAFVGGLLDMISKFDPIVQKLTGLESAFSAIAAVLILRLIPGVGALTGALGGLVAGAGWRGLIGLLGMLGLGGGAAILGGAALGAGLGMMPGSAGEGEDEFARQKRIQEGKPAVPPKPEGTGAKVWRWIKEKAGIGGASARETAEGQPGGETVPRGRSAGSMASAMQFAMDQLRKEGVPEENLHAAAAHLVGQAWMESSLDPNTVHDGGTGYGIYGARDPGGRGRQRRSEMLAWLSANGYARNSLEGQMRYMAHEAMTGGYRGTRRTLMNATEQGLVGDSWGVTREFEAPLVTNDRSGAVLRAYRAGRAAEAAKSVNGAMSDEAAAAARRNSFADRVNAGGSIADPAPSAPAIGAHDFSRHTTIGNTVNQTNKIVVNGARDPGATAKATAGAQARVNSELLRNIQGASR